MSIRPRGKAWLVDVKVKGKRVRQTARDRAEARQLEARIRQELIEDINPEHGLEEALLKYIKEYIPHLKDQRGQKSKAKMLRPHLYKKTFTDVPAIAAEIKSLPLAPATINRRLALLRRLCSLAYKEWDWLKRPVAQKISLLSEKNQRHVYLTVKQVERIAKHCDQGAADAIWLAAYTGLRRSELFQIGPENVQKGMIILDAGTKTGRPRMVPIHRSVRPIIKRLPLQTTDALLRKQWVKARKKAKLEHVRFHDLRHTMASWLAQSGASLSVIGEILGHSEAQTTKRYTHLTNEALKQAMGRVK